MRKLVQDAAKDLFETVARQHGATEDLKDDNEGPRFWHYPDEVPPAGIYYEHFLEGTLKELSKAICPAKGDKANEKQLRTKGFAGKYWIVRESGQKYHVWFRTEGEYKKCSERLEKPTKSDAGETHV